MGAGEAAIVSTPVGRLPLITINHVSYAVPEPQVTAHFFEQVLGFRRLKRPDSFEKAFDGAWLCGMGVEIHLIQPKTADFSGSFPKTIAADDIDPRSDHLSFLCNDMDVVTAALEEWEVKYVESEFRENGMRQVRYVFDLLPFV